MPKYSSGNQSENKTANQSGKNKVQQQKSSVGQASDKSNMSKQGAQRWSQEKPMNEERNLNK